MDNICRLCCSTKFVNNYIFDDENALFIKMSLYLPIKVLKNDQLPQKICDRCSCKVNDFYQFCNETIEVQNRLREIVISSKVATEQSIDLTIIKQNSDSPPPAWHSVPAWTEKSTQTESYVYAVKDEPAPFSTHKIKEENENDSDMVCDTDLGIPDVSSDVSDEEFLINIKKKKRSKKCNLRNGETKEVRKGRKRKEKHAQWNTEPQPLINNSCNGDVKDIDLNVIKQEIEFRPSDLGGVLRSINDKPKKDVDNFYKCCICFEECDTRADMLQHYKSHGKLQAAEMLPPPPPSGDTPRCLRCQKVVAIVEWAEHWRRHYARDVRPYRCAMCYRAFRDHHHILKHGLTHTPDEFLTSNGDGDGTGVAKDENSIEAANSEKRFACDVCPLGFVYMRCLLSHRTRAHPEAASRALRVRCAVCARTFAHSNSLRRHLRAHSGERNFLCNVCGKALSSREHLKFHIRIHTGYKPHVCKTCGKGFVKKCNLTLHERVHSGEKPHVCSHCGKAFSQRSTLVIHERYHSGARPYSCGLCGRGFVAKGLLSMHLKSTCVSLPPPSVPPPLAPLVRCHKLSSR